MNPLVKKEIRLLLPAWVTAMTLVILPEMLVQIATRHNARPPNPMLFVLFGLGVLLLALATFGQEFSSRTFPILLAQPVLRSRIWRIKVSVLIIALLSVSLVFLLGFWTEPMALDLEDKEFLSLVSFLKTPQTAGKAYKNKIDAQYYAIAA